VVDAALGFVSQSEFLTDRDAVGVLEAVRDVLARTPAGSAVTSVVDQTLSTLSTRTTRNRGQVVDALLDIRQAIVRTDAARGCAHSGVGSADASDCAMTPNAESAAPEASRSDDDCDRDDPWTEHEERSRVMRASIGDRVVVRSRHVGVPERIGDIVEIRGVEGTPPYLVRWHDSGSAGLVYPGSDATIDSSPPRRD